MISWVYGWGLRMDIYNWKFLGRFKGMTGIHRALRLGIMEGQNRKHMKWKLGGSRDGYRIYWVAVKELKLSYHNGYI